MNRSSCQAELTQEAMSIYFIIIFFFWMEGSQPVTASPLSKFLTSAVYFTLIPSIGKHRTSAETEPY